MTKNQPNRKRKDVAAALEAGWEYVKHSGSGHMIFRHPGGGPQMVLSGSLGGGRGDRNAIAWIRKNTPRGATV